MKTDAQNQLNLRHIAHLDAEISRWRQYEKEGTGFNDTPTDDFDSAFVIASLRLAIERACPPKHPLLDHMMTALTRSEAPARTAANLAAHAQTLRNAIADDQLETFEQLVHAELFDDFLEMAQHLLDQKYQRRSRGHRWRLPRVSSKEAFYHARTIHH